MDFNFEKFVSSDINSIKNNINSIKTSHIFVLAGGQISNGDVNDWVRERLNLTIKLEKKNKDANIYCIGGGTYHKPPVTNKYNFVIHESKSCSNYLIKKNIDKKKIKREWCSYDTIGNSFFSFLLFIKPLDIKECVIITSKFHLERVKLIFNYFLTLFKCDTNITYLFSENNMDNELLKLRMNREKKSIENFKKNVISKFKSLKEFYDWFYIEHNAYNCKNKIEQIDNLTKNSY